MITNGKPQCPRSVREPSLRFDSPVPSAARCPQFFRKSTMRSHAVTASGHPGGSLSRAFGNFQSAESPQFSKTRCVCPCPRGSHQGFPSHSYFIRDHTVLTIITSCLCARICPTFKGIRTIAPACSLERARASRESAYCNTIELLNNNNDI